jgi:hypothetical protein
MLERLSEMLGIRHDRGHLVSLLHSEGFKAGQLTGRAMARAQLPGGASDPAGRQQSTDPSRLGIAYRLAAAADYSALGDDVSHGAIVAAVRGAFDSDGSDGRGPCTPGLNLVGLGGCFVSLVTRLDATLHDLWSSGANSNATAASTAASDTIADAASTAVSTAASTAASTETREAAVEVCAHPGCSNTHDLKRCGRCGQVAYCSRAHQVAAWGAHKAVCSKPKEASVARLHTALPRTLSSALPRKKPTDDEYELMSSQLTMLLSQVDDILEPERSLDAADAELMGRMAMLTPYESALKSDRALLHRAAAALVEAANGFADECSVESCLPTRGLFQRITNTQLLKASEQQRESSLRLGHPVIIRALANGMRFETLDPFADESLRVAMKHLDMEPCAGTPCSNGESMTLQLEGQWLNGRVGRILQFDGPATCKVQLLGLEGIGLQPSAGIMVAVKRLNLAPCDMDYYASYMAKLDMIRAAVSAAADLEVAGAPAHEEGSPITAEYLY